MRRFAATRPPPRAALLGLGAALALWCAGQGTARALEIPPPKAPVTDLAGVLDPAARSQLNEALIRYREETGHQFAVLILPSLEGEAIEELSIRLVERGQWRLGDKKEDNGLLMLIAMADRKMRIEVGYGLEGVIPDALAGRVVREILRPAFQAGDFAGGIAQGLQVLMQAGRGEQVDVVWRRPGARHRRGAPGGLVSLLVFALFFLSPLFFRRGRRGGGFFYMGGGGFGGGGFGGGGGWDGGGGGFGGGGASGDW